MDIYYHQLLTQICKYLSSANKEIICCFYSKIYNLNSFVSNWGRFLFIPMINKNIIQKVICEKLKKKHTLPDFPPFSFFPFYLSFSQIWGNPLYPSPLNTPLVVIPYNATDILRHNRRPM